MRSTGGCAGASSLGPAPFFCGTMITLTRESLGTVAPGAVVPKDSRVKVIIVPQKKGAAGSEAPQPPVDLKADPGKN